MLLYDNIEVRGADFQIVLNKSLPTYYEGPQVDVPQIGPKYMGPLNANDEEAIRRIAELQQCPIANDIHLNKLNNVLQDQEISVEQYNRFFENPHVVKAMKDVSKLNQKDRDILQKLGNTTMRQPFCKIPDKYVPIKQAPNYIPNARNNINSVLNNQKIGFNDPAQLFKVGFAGWGVVVLLILACVGCRAKSVHVLDRNEDENTYVNPNAFVDDPYQNVYENQYHDADPGLYHSRDQYHAVSP